MGTFQTEEDILVFIANALVVVKMDLDKLRDEYRLILTAASSN